MVDVLDPRRPRPQPGHRERVDGTLRLTLNGAENSRTLAGRFIREIFGSSVQHLAFATADIFATGDGAARQRIPALPIPPNYYDDLDARFGLDRGADRHAAVPGTSSTIATRAASTSSSTAAGFGEGFFFEIVERRGYRGYGGPNAPFRIAAQKRAMHPAATRL